MILALLLTFGGFKEDVDSLTGHLLTAATRDEMSGTIIVFHLNCKDSLFERRIRKRIESSISSYGDFSRYSTTSFLGPSSTRWIEIL